MKNWLILLLVSFWATALSAQENEKLQYAYEVDLNNIESDLLKVSLILEEGPKESEILFHLPKIVPGTYSIYNFGRFVENKSFKAFKANGRKLKVEKVGKNSWKIRKANKLARIEYEVEDTWDTKKSNVIFEPAGTNFDEEVVVFNNHGIFGYFEGYERFPYSITVKRPSEWFGGTSLERTGGDASTDIFSASSYNELVDAPILFAKPDTALIKVGDTDVLIHTYSPTGRVNSKALVADIQPILEAQRAYLGGTLPVDHYAFLIFLNEENESYLSRSAGALEHSYSSLYTLFEGEAASIAQTVRDVAAHEFFHIVTPLNIHSEEIHYFNFIEPEMSKHLWLYEGATEYAAQHVQVKEGLVPPSHFFKVMGDKMATAERFKQDLSFTEMSETCLDKNKSQYYNVYQKGALISMALDLKLLLLSEGQYDLQDLMRDLSEEYGPSKPFEDEELFAEIARIAKQPELLPFFEKHVAGIEPLPIGELLDQVGVNYFETGRLKVLSPLGGLEDQKAFQVSFAGIKVKDAERFDTFGEDKLGFQEGDLLMEWNGSKLDMQSINTILGNYASAAKEGDVLRVKVLRDGKEQVLEGKLAEVEVERPHVFKLKENSSEAELKLLRAWLGSGLNL